MTTFEQREYREKHGFSDIEVPDSLFLEYSSGGEVYSSAKTRIIGSKKADVEVCMFIHRPNATWRIFIYEEGFGGCNLLDELTSFTLQEKDKAIKLLAKRCKKIFKKDIELKAQELQFSL